MNKFTSGQFSIKDEFDGKKDAPRVVKSETIAKPQVSDFQYQKIVKPGEGTYAATKAKFGPLASTDPDRQSKGPRDSRFSLNPLLRDPLAVEQEERRAIDEQVRAQVESMAEQTKAQAREEGYQDGLKQGHAEAFERFKAEAEERMTAIEGLLASFEGAREEIYRANERFLMEMVLRLARLVVARELKTDAEYVLRIAGECLERVGIKDNVRIRIRPQEMETLAMLREGLEKKLGTMKNLSIEASDEVQLGGCMIDTDWNAIDATIETQLAHLHETLLDLGKVAHGEDGAQE